MKTYTTTTKEPRLKIEYDDDAQSPREWSNLGYFITCDSNYNSPDKHEELEQFIKDTGEEATSQAEHIKMIKDDFEWNNSEEKVIAIYPISKYEHGNISYSLGTSNGFDYSNNGFYIITAETQKELGVKKKDFEQVIKEELEDYNKWINGEMYNFILYDKDGEVVHTCGGFYDIEDIREYLPKEWNKEDLSDYLID